MKKRIIGTVITMTLCACVASNSMIASVVAENTNAPTVPHSPKSVPVYTADGLSVLPGETAPGRGAYRKVEYVDAMGQPVNPVRALVLDTSKNNVILNSGISSWYVVTEDAVVSSRIRVVGDVNLIIPDGVKLTAQKGVEVSEGNWLTIYSQQNSSGTLMATGSTKSAGIGGGILDESDPNSEVSEPGYIQINGGIVGALGRDGAAGIGGGAGSTKAGNIVVAGGHVYAYGSDMGAGIGAGYRPDGRNTEGLIRIDGGFVTAAGGCKAAGIGGAAYGGAVSVIVNNGYVHAMGGESGCGIGTGFSGQSNNKCISLINGTIMAESGAGGYGIGSYDGTALIAMGYDEWTSPIIVTDSISNHNDSSNWQSLVIESGAGTIYGQNFILDEIFEVPEYAVITLNQGQTFTILDGCGLSCISGTRFVNYGKIIVGDNCQFTLGADFINHGCYELASAPVKLAEPLTLTGKDLVSIYMDGKAALDNIILINYSDNTTFECELKNLSVFENGATRYKIICPINMAQTDTTILASLFSGPVLIGQYNYTVNASSSVEAPTESDNSYSSGDWLPSGSGNTETDRPDASASTQVTAPSSVPVQPEKPGESSRPSKPVPTEAVNPSKPIPTESIKPSATETTQATKPAPTDMTNPSKPTPTEATQATKPTPTETTKPSKPTPTETTQATKPAPTETTVPVPDDGQWHANTVYNEGDIIFYKGHNFQAQWWTQGDEPNANDPWGAWIVVGEDVPPSNTPAPWDPNAVYVGGEVVTFHGRSFEAQWWTQGEQPNANDSWGVWKVID